MKITNMGRAPRGIPVGRKIEEVEPGASLNMSAEEWEQIEDRDDIAALVEANVLVVSDEGEERKPKKTRAPKTPAATGGEGA